jgi:Na+:H+ antiporter, NhaA family
MTSPVQPTPSTPPPEAWPPLQRALKRAAGPLDRFLHIEAASGIILLVAAALALTLANSGWADAYGALWHTAMGIRVGSFSFERSLEWVVNDGLMVIFFFVVGLEIRRELHRGELSEWRRASLPVIAALGGVVVPALLYLLLAGAPGAREGWAVPTATDIAFAVGVLALLGKRAPPALRVLLLALAVIDDLAAIVVIAAFYSKGIELWGLAVAAAGIALVFVLRAAGIRPKLAYVPAGLIAWAGIYAAGIHPTIAGVLLGLITPVRAWLGAEGFLRVAPRQFEVLSNVVNKHPDDAHAFAGALQPLLHARREALSPAEALIERLHPWVAFVVMPLFALANAGVSLEGMSLDGTSGAVAMGVAVGLVAGKPLGILLFSGLALKLGISRLPAGIRGAHLLVLGMVAGIGFTMALFIAQLAFAAPELLAAAKLGVLCASALAGVLGLTLGRALLSQQSSSAGVALTADEAECSTEA